MKIKNLFDKLFMSADWNIAYRKNEHGFFDYSQPFASLPCSKEYWLADPLLYKEGEDVYLFCEAFDRKTQKGKLAVFKWVNNAWTEFKIILEENYHLSYPCVFQYDNRYYMIPESTEKESLQLFATDLFPHGWKKEKVLVDGVKLADPTVFVMDGQMFVCAYEGKRLFFYELDMENKKVEQKGSVDYLSDVGRPAGYIIECDSKKIRPAQDNSKLYGKSIIFRELYQKNDVFYEKNLFELDVKKINIDNSTRADRIHTYSSAGDFEVIDYGVFRFDLFKRIKVLKRNIIMRKRKKGDIDADNKK